VAEAARLEDAAFKSVTAAGNLCQHCLTCLCHKLHSVNSKCGCFMHNRERSCSQAV
jgi:hypothetical protein